MLAVPSRTNLALVALTGRAVLAVRGVRSAASMVPGLAAWLPGRDTPLRGRPDWLLGLGTTWTVRKILSKNICSPECLADGALLLRGGGGGGAEAGAGARHGAQRVVVQHHVHDPLLVSLHLAHVHLGTVTSLYCHLLIRYLSSVTCSVSALVLSDQTCSS